MLLKKSSLFNLILLILLGCFIMIAPLELTAAILILYVFALIIQTVTRWIDCYGDFYRYRISYDEYDRVYLVERKTWYILYFWIEYNQTFSTDEVAQQYLDEKIKNRETFIFRLLKLLPRAFRPKKTIRTQDN